MLHIPDFYSFPLFRSVIIRLLADTLPARGPLALACDVSLSPLKVLGDGSSLLFGPTLVCCCVFPSGVDCAHRQSLLNLARWARLESVSLTGS